MVSKIVWYEKIIVLFYLILIYLIVTALKAFHCNFHFSYEKLEKIVSLLINKKKLLDMDSLMSYVKPTRVKYPYPAYI